MNRKIVFVLSLFALLSFLPYGFNTSEVKVDGYPVHNIDTGFNYTTIQEAINAPKTLDGNTILVDVNVYYESVVVNKTVTIIGENVRNTVIDGGDTASYIFHIIANHVVIENFTLKDTNPDPTSYSCAIQVYNATDVVIKNVIITDVVIGVDVRCSNYTKIMYSIINKSITWGIEIHSASCNNTIVGNTFEMNPTAVFFADIKSKFSKVYHNNFINNTNDVTLYAVNYFSDGYPAGGNYWSNYNGTDLYCGSCQNETGSDGIGDTAHIITGSIQDNYPIMGVFSNFFVISEEQTCYVNIVSDSTVSTFKFHRANRIIQFNVTSGEGIGFCRVCIHHTLISPPYTVIIDNGQTEVLYSNDNLYDNGTHRWIYFTYMHSEHEVVIMTSAPPIIDIVSPTEQSPICAHPGMNGIVTYSYTEYNPCNATIEVYNATHTIGTTIINDLEEGIDIERTDVVYLEAWATNGQYDVKITVCNFAGLSGEDMKTSAVIVDVAPPVIENVFQEPAEDSVYPDNKVEVFANVTDDLSRVRQVVLNYTINNTAWFTVDMENLEENVYNATIPQLQYCTNVTYVVIAEDNANNTITTEELGYEYQYQVVRESPPMLMLPLFIMVTLLAAIVYRKVFRTAL